MSLDNIDDVIRELENGHANVRFQRLLNICEHYFGKPRTKGSHHIFKMPWSGDPRINLQETKGGKAKPYQINQVLDALHRLPLEK